MRTYEPSEFISQLASKQLVEPVDLTLYGLAKADENDSSVLCFSSSLSCEQWISIPVSLISSVAHVRNVKCKDHQHPLVRIVLAEPNKEDTSAVLFMQLFAQAKATTPAKRMSKANAMLARQECEVLEFDDVPYLCCGGECWILL
ncbi:hypothetical protein HGP16_13120 [Rhizobium sp. P40RR-XXII]|uniref:hypothetical protein n=1 Tax=Rhizobium sp. P40RR-XXII TaxID=2726739 RepID=UPI0014577DD2|nr:hypothetical protein [Rhizobium sp. P40RR-XXII]NLS17498.1 hypothetical protein [Rhizobium sp. P40RR-XXII]